MHKWHDIRLTAGDHSSPGDGLCLMEAVALFTGERHGDWPACVCPVLIEFGRVLNDTMPDKWRTDLLLPIVPALVGTRDPLSDSCSINATGLERKRAAALLTWCVNSLAGVTRGDDEAELHVGGALADAKEALRFGQVQHAARNAAAALAWAAKVTADRELASALSDGRPPHTAAEPCDLILWRGAVAAYRNAVRYGEPRDLTHSRSTKLHEMTGPLGSHYT